MTDWTPRNIYFLGLITAGYVVGEIAHFLIATTSKAHTITWLYLTENTFHSKWSSSGSN